MVKNAKYSDVKRAIPPIFFIPYRQDETHRADQLLRADRQRSRAVPEQHSEGAGAARRQPAGGEPAHAAAAGARERVPRSVHQRAVGVVRLPGDAARGGRALRRARLHRVAADARDRSADGARRRAVAGAGDGAAAGRGDGGRSAARSASARRSASAGWRSRCCSSCRAPTRSCSSPRPCRCRWSRSPPVSSRRTARRRWIR